MSKGTLNNLLEKIDWYQNNIDYYKRIESYKYDYYVKKADKLVTLLYGSKATSEKSS